MRLSWKDGVATAAVALVVTVYLLFVAGADVVLISSAQAAGTVMLLFGMVGCAYGAADELFGAKKKSTARMTYLVITSALGVTAAAAGLIAVIFGYEIALTILLAATVTMWLLATARHTANTWRAAQMTGGVPENRREVAPL